MSMSINETLVHALIVHRQAAILCANTVMDGSVTSVAAQRELQESDILVDAAFDDFLRDPNFTIALINYPNTPASWDVVRIHLEGSPIVIEVDTSKSPGEPFVQELNPTR